MNDWSPKPALVHQIRPPRVTSAGPPPMLLLLHGIGADEFDLLDLAGEFDPRFLVVSARAPHPWGPGFAWFELDVAGDGLQMDLEQAHEGRELLAGFIAASVETYTGDPSRVYLAGFSQGAMMAAAVALARPDLVAGVVMMSGVLPALPGAAQGPLPPFMIVHGTYDAMLPPQLGRAARDALRALGATVAYREYPMAHQISQASITDVSVWLTDQLGAP